MDVDRNQIFIRKAYPLPLTNQSQWIYNSFVAGLVAQLGAHHIRIVGVGSSNLLKSTIERKYELCIL